MPDPTANPYLPPLAAAEPVLLKDPRALGLLACWFYGGSTGLVVLIHFATMALPVDALNDDESPVFLGYVLANLLAVFLTLAGIVLYLCWKYRAARNARGLDPAVMSISPGMAAGGYFIPFVNFFIPVMAMNAISRVSIGGSYLVAPWWALHLLSGIFTIIAIQAGSGSDLIAAPGTFDHVMIGTEVLAAVLSVILVMRITRAQTAVAQNA